MSWLRRDAIEVGWTVRVLVKHTVYVVVSVFCMWLIEFIIGHLWSGNKEPTVFGEFPLKYAFEAADLGMVAAFYYYALREIRRIHAKDRDT